MQINQFKFAVFCICFLALSCNKNNSDVSVSLTIEKVYSVDIEELSGLCAYNSDILYAVSDNTNKIYKISTTGKLLGNISTTGEDLEGVAINSNDQSIYIVEERKRDILQYDKFGNMIRTIAVSVENRDINSGLEGICINPMNNNIFVLNEKSPGKLIELNSSGSQIFSADLHFALDYSDMCINPNEEEIWILSDESRKIVKCDTKGNLIEEYNVNINKMEGISIDFSKKLIFIVSDSYKKLYQLNLPD